MVADRILEIQSELSEIDDELLDIDITDDAIAWLYGRREELEDELSDLNEYYDFEE